MARKASPIRIVANEGEARPLSRATGAPLHHQIFLVLRDQILSGRYSGGASLPSEEELAKLFGVSRITVRTALKNLDAHGLIDRRQGVGTFVRDNLPQVPIHVGIRDQRAYIEESARRTSIKLLEFEYGPAPPDVRRWFNCGADELFLRVVRLRSAERPALLLTTYMPEHIGKLFRHEDYAREAHYELLSQAGVQIASGEQVISAMLADPVIAARLEIDVGAPLLRIFHFDLDQDERPIRLLEVLAPPSEYEIHMKIDGAPAHD
jgi:GntR family transcriptional regulator